MQYTVVIEKAGNNFSAFVPDLPGCIATGKTTKDVRRAIQEAIAFHIEGMREDGLPVPRPQARAVNVAAPSAADRRAPKRPRRAAA